MPSACPQLRPARAAGTRPGYPDPPHHRRDRRRDRPGHRSSRPGAGPASLMAGRRHQIPPAVRCLRLHHAHHRRGHTEPAGRLNAPAALCAWPSPAAEHQWLSTTGHIRGGGPAGAARVCVRSRRVLPPFRRLRDLVRFLVGLHPARPAIERAACRRWRRVPLDRQLWLVKSNG